MRWYLYTASPPGQERRFSSDLVGDVLRNFTLTVWNTYSFFVTYANLDGWTPDPLLLPEYSSLDKWVLSALHTLVRDVSEALENYDVLGATRPIQGFVDQLSNWYLRRSRRRFWKSESDGDKYAAYATLYEALTTISKLLAPTMPFIADELYQNLVRSLNPNAQVSVHLEKWPEYKPEWIDENINKEMALVMKLASVGHAARNRANRKVRQPLAEAAFSVGNAEERAAVLKYADILKDELNVKEIRVLDAATEAVSYEVKPLPKQLGQKYGSKFPAIRTAIQMLDTEFAAKTLLDDKPLSVFVDGMQYDILPEEVEVKAQAKEGFAVASEGPYLVALVTDLTPELEMEGLAREFVRRVQDLRKTADFDIADRIRLYYLATPKLAQAIKAFAGYIKGETLTIELKEEKPLPDFTAIETEFDGETVSIGVSKN
jgi:isoleucyl-tRNA synthetase